MQLCTGNEHMIRPSRGYSAAPFGPTMQFVRNVLEDIIDAVMESEVGEVSPRNILTPADRPPNEWHAQLPEVSGLSESRDRQLVRHVKGQFAMQPDGLAVGFSLPGGVALEVEWRSQADLRMRL
jgi:hypothetical protein